MKSAQMALQEITEALSGMSVERKLFVLSLLMRDMADAGLLALRPMKEEAPATALASLYPEGAFAAKASSNGPSAHRSFQEKCKAVLAFLRSPTAAAEVAGGKRHVSNEQIREGARLPRSTNVGSILKCLEETGAIQRSGPPRARTIAVRIT